MKKRLMILLTLLVIASQTCVLAEDTSTERHSGDYRYFLLEDGTAALTGYSGDEQDLILPAELDGHPVTAIADGAFALYLTLNSITLPDGVTAIGNYAFSESYNLTQINLPDTLLSIGNEAFYGCASLTSLTIPDSVTVMGANPFYDCYNLTDIIISPDHPIWEVLDGVLFSKAEKKLICYPFVFTAESYAVPQGTQVIGSGAFAGTSLTSISLPDSIVLIEENAFGFRPAPIITVNHGTYAEQWCMDNGIPNSCPCVSDN